MKDACTSDPTASTSCTVGSTPSWLLDALEVPSWPRTNLREWASRFSRACAPRLKHDIRPKASEEFLARSKPPDGPLRARRFGTPACFAADNATSHEEAQAGVDECRGKNKRTNETPAETYQWGKKTVAVVLCTLSCCSFATPRLLFGFPIFSFVVPTFAHSSRTRDG